MEAGGLTLVTPGCEVLVTPGPGQGEAPDPPELKGWWGWEVVRAGEVLADTSPHLQQAGDPALPGPVSGEGN